MSPAIDWHTARLTIATPPDFNFWRTAFSHGWCDLPPFTFDQENQTLSRILTTTGGTLVSCFMKERAGRIIVDIRSRSSITGPKKQSVRAQLRHCLRLDEDFGPFLKSARNHPQFRWISASKSGRMLRSPTVFEDAVKMLCTTNCSWALTRIMITNLVRLTGKEFGDGRFAFPGPADVAALSERDLRKKIKAGYRAPYLKELAEAIVSGKLEIESLRSSPLSTVELTEKFLTIKGIGPYAAENLLKLLGRYDRLGLDSWTRGRFYKLHCRGRKVKDATIEKHYEEFGEWRGLLFWLEMTRDWHDKQ